MATRAMPAFLNGALTKLEEESIMPRGDKSAYTEKQKRQAQHIEEGYIDRGVPEEEAEARAWATVNKMSGGGKKSGSGRGKAGGAAAAARTPAERSASARKAAQTRARNAANKKASA
jgi:plasmid stabilization system protein ParE